MFETRSDLDKAFAAAGLAAFAPAVARLCAPALCLVPAGQADTVEGGRSRLGGAPELPGDLAWPVRPAYVRPDASAEQWPTQRANLRLALTTPAPLHFLGEIDLAAAARAVAPKGRMPESGRLHLFWDAKCGPWIESTASCRVLWDRSPASALVARAAPAGLNEADDAFDLPALFPGRPIAFLPVLSMPDRHLLAGVAERAGEHALAASLDDPAFEDEWDALWDGFNRWQLASGRAVDLHRLGGWPVPEQDDPRSSAVAAALAFRTPYSEQQRAQIHAAIHDWTLLAQIDLHALWRGFAEGIVYFVMRETDLLARNFERVHAIYQQT